MQAGSHQAGIDLFEKAVTIDPEFASAYAELGFWKTIWWSEDALLKPFNHTEAVQIASSYFKKAIEIDPNNSLAHHHKAYVHLWYEWDFKKAEREYQIGNQLSANFFGFLFIATERYEELLILSEQWLEIDPLSPYALCFNILALHFTGQQERTNVAIARAIELADIIIDVAGLYTLYNWGVAQVYLDLGMYEEVKDISTGNLPLDLSIKAIAHYHLGEMNETKDLIEEIELKYGNTNAPSPSFSLAMIYAQLDDIDKAFELLENAYQNHEILMIGLKYRPQFDPLRKTPAGSRCWIKWGFLSKR